MQIGDQLPSPALSRGTAEGEVQDIRKEQGKEEEGHEQDHLSRSWEGWSLNRG